LGGARAGGHHRARVLGKREAIAVAPMTDAATATTPVPLRRILLALVISSPAV
jgi:hypothetical protein